MRREVKQDKGLRELEVFPFILTESIQFKVCLQDREMYKSTPPNFRLKRKLSGE